MTARRLAQGIAGAALIALPFVYRDPYHLHILILILIWSFAYTSWSMMGRFGLVSLGHGGFMGVGAYVTALLWNHLGISPWLGIPIAMAAAALLAVIVAYPCFRFRITGHYFVLVTLALSGIVLQVITATRDYTGGSLGYTPDRTRGSHLLALQFDDKTTWYLIALGVWAAGLLIWRWVDRSMDRYALEAISEDEDAAAAAGVNVTWEKLKITVISALMTALSGALYCQYQMFISPDTVSGIAVSLQMVFAAIVGGLYMMLGRPSAPSSPSCWPKSCASASAPRRRLGQSRLRRAAGGVHHLPAQGHFGQHRRAAEGAAQEEARRRGLSALMLLAMTIAVTRFRRTLD